METVNLGTEKHTFVSTIDSKGQGGANHEYVI